MTGESMTDEMAGMTSVVTGATSGIGRELARLLAAKGSRVIGVGRSSDRCREAEQGIRDATGNPRVAFVMADLSSLSEFAFDPVLHSGGIHTTNLTDFKSREE